MNMFKLSQIITKSNRLSSLIRYNSLTASPAVNNIKNKQFDDEQQQPQQTLEGSSVKKNQISQNSMVAAAFASLNSNENTKAIKTPLTDAKVEQATTVDELLSVSVGMGITRRHALKVVSILADWSAKGKVELADFETDPRFLKLCRILTKTNNNNNNNPHRNKYAAVEANKSEDLSTILSVTADDEAAKLVASITLSQMIKVLSTLAKRKRRSTMLLRSLSYNITATPDKFNLKDSADLLYSITVLNFPDENLLERISEEVCNSLPYNSDKSAVVGSILTSVGLLRYKNIELLDNLSEWILKHHTICRPQDIFSLFMTLAAVNYIPANAEQLFKELVPLLTLEEAGRPQNWLDIVWSLVLLNQANNKHVASVLSENFLKPFQDNLNPSTFLKVLNIDAAAKYLLKDYTEPRLSANSFIRSTHILRSKEKLEMVDAINDTLKNLIHDEKYLKSNIDTGYGFFIDAELFVDKNCHPLPLDQKDSNPNGIKIAILALDYHDMCRGKLEPNGVNNLAKNILEAQCYKIVFIPYKEFKAKDKVVARVKYIQEKLKEILLL